MDAATPPLERSLTLRGAVALNLLDMIGVGPFITLPLLLSAMGGPQAMLGWVLGALLAACDGMVWAELGAAMPEAGGTYRYLGAMFPGRIGRWLSFIFVFQLCISAPLSVASGCIGLAQYAAYLAPQLGAEVLVATPLRESFLAVCVVLVAVALLYRKLSATRGLAMAMLAVVLFTIVWTIVTGMLRGHLHAVFAFAPGAFRLNRAFFAGLGSAMLIATYDYWGYYNVTFLGGEVRDGARVIPRAVLLSIAIVAVLYLGLNASVLSVLGTPAIMGAQGLGARRALLPQFMQTAYGPWFGAHIGTVLGLVAAMLVMVTAFASVFSLLLGYSRIPFAAARDGNFPAMFARLHPCRGFPYVSLLFMAGAACICCFFSLAHVIAALVVLRILLQFSMQHVGLLLLHKREPGRVWPFKMWLYPLPPLVALTGFAYIVLSRPGFSHEVLAAGLVAVAGSVAFVLRAWWRQRVKHPAAVSGT